MREPLQPFGFKESVYERVNLEWTCSCPGGPDAKGRCQSDPPCVPVRSVRSKRGILTRMVALGTLGILLIFLYGKQQGDFLSPGELNPVHANLEQGCASCHSAADQPPEAWLAAAFSNTFHSEAENGCLGCHDFGKRAENMFAPHGMSPAELAASQSEPGELASSEFDPWSVQCNDCHREHQGAGYDLLAAAEASCKSCHVEHTSFPEFHGSGKGLLERDRRPAVVFDHDLHLARANFNASCTDCHMTPDERGDLPISMIAGLSYERNCTQCHDSDGNNTGHDNGLETGFDRTQPKGVGKLKDTNKLTYLRLPKYSDEVKDNKASVEVKPWTQVGGSSNLSLSSEAKILLGEAYTTWMELGNKKVSYRRFGRKEAEEQAAPLRLLTAVQEALAELGNGDLALARASLARRVEESIGMSLDADHVAELLPRELHEVLVKAHQEWLVSPITEVPADAPKDGPVGRGFFAHDLEVSYVPRPQEGFGSVHADPLVKAWAPLVARLALMEDPTDNADEPSTLKALSNSFAGRCVMCHTIDQESSDPASLAIRWSPLEIDNEDTSQFVHAPHIGRKDCMVCHESTGQELMQFNSLSVTKREKLQPPLDPSVHVASFQSIELSSCAECHAPSKEVSSDCTTCHNFHPQRSTHFSAELAGLAGKGEE